MSVEAATTIARKIMETFTLKNSILHLATQNDNVRCCIVGKGIRTTSVISISTVWFTQNCLQPLMTTLAITWF